ncbi:MAG TPA: PAS domain-containing protein [Rhodocyclaceae bacterium]|nr:PAS domain-containing protein [Rhodocyclaceae bacterium]
MNLLFGLRGRVWLLVALLTVPLFLYSLLVYRDHRAQAMARVEQDFQQLLRSALVGETYLVKHTHDVLRIMANANDMKALSGPECAGLARRLLQSQRDYQDFGAVLPDGTLLCSGLSPAGPAAFADAPWFREAMERKDFSLGHYVPGPVTEAPGIVFAYPLLDAAGRVRAVAFASVGLGWLANLPFGDRLPPGWEAAVVVPGGRLISRQPMGSQGLADDGELAALLRNGKATGMHELAGPEGRPYLYGIAALASTGGQVRVLIGAPKSTVLMPVEQDFRNHMILLMLLGIASVLLGQQAIYRFFVGWAERLHGDIGRIGAGARQLGAPKRSSIRELREIDAALRAMVDNVNAGEAALKASQESLGLALEGAALGAWDWRLSVGMTSCNARMAQMLGYPPDELLVTPETWAHMSHPDDRAGALAAADRHLRGDTPIYECEFRMRHQEGHWIWLLVHGRVVERDAAGQPLRLAGTALDITARKATEQQLRQRTEELVALVEAMPALVWIARDPECREMAGNHAANQLEGWREAVNGSADVPGAESRPRTRFYGQDGREYAVEELPMQRAAAEGRPVQGAQIEVRLPDGRNLWLFGNAAPLFDDQGSVRGALGAFVDITQFKASEADLRRHRDELESLVAERTYELAVAKESAERANRTKSQFLANISHELRTPLNSLMLLARVLSDNSWDNLTPQQIEYARMIELSGNDLVHLIDELLDLTRIETGRLDIRVKPIPFPDLMQSLRRTHRHVAEHKGLDFKMEIDADVPATMVTDPMRLQQLLRNLLSNAIKFTTQGGVTLRIRRAVSGWRYNNPALAGAEAVIAFDVIDTGIGIEPAEQERILEALGLIRTQAARELNGTGLGLAISREIATLLGGELGLVSIPGQGSTFSVYLPLVYAGPTVQVAGERVAVAAPGGEKDPLLAGRTVLVVDDDHFSRYAVSAILEKQGMRVVEAASGAEALEALSREAAVDAVLMDIIMPTMDGYQTTGVIRASLGRRALPIIALTANASAGSREASLAAGCSDHLCKPVSKADLLACLHRWLEPVPVEA